MDRIPATAAHATRDQVRQAPVTVGTEGVLHFVDQYTGRWHKLPMTVKKVGEDRMQLHVFKPVLPYPASWDFRKLLGLEEVWFDVNGTVVRGRPSGAAGANLTVSYLTPGSLPT